MIRIKTLKVNKKELRSYKKKNVVVNNWDDLLVHFKQLSKEEKEARRKNIKFCEEAKRNLNITEETRRKKKSELSQKEIDILYDEYVYNSIIHSCQGAIKHGTCDIKYLLEKIEKELEAKAY